MSNDTPTDRRYVVIGAGAVGSQVTVELTRGGIDAVLVAREAEYRPIKANGVVVHTPTGTTAYRVPLAQSVEEVKLADSDIVLLATKAQDAESVLRDLAWQPATTRTGGNTSASRAVKLVTLQNGLNTERAALRWFSDVYGTTGGFGLNKEKRGEIVSYSNPHRGIIWIGRFPGGEDEVSRQIARDLSNSGGLLVESVPNIQEWKAWKLIHNTSNILEVLYAPSKLRDRAAAILEQEYVQVLRAIGIEPADPYADTKLDFGRYLKSHEPVSNSTRPGSSTLQSYNRGVSLETDYLNGEVALLARLHNVAAPLNAELQLLAHNVTQIGGVAPLLSDADLEQLLDTIDTDSGVDP